MIGKMIKMSLDISPRLNEELEQMSEEAHASKGDILRNEDTEFHIKKTVPENTEDAKLRRFK